jgi:tellurite resistance protein TerB
MGVFDDVNKWAKTQASSLSDAVKKFKNKKFMEATVAGCAMVAFSDGTVKPEEKAKMAAFIKRNEALNVFEMPEVITAFEKYVQGFEFDLQIGKGEALNAIGKIKKNSDEAKLLIRVCCAIGTSDGDFDDSEKAAVREICRELELNPEEFGLQGTVGNMPEWMQKK